MFPTSINFSFQVDFLDTVADGVEVSRQDLGGGQYRWTITFLDEGDDFDLVPENQYTSNVPPPFLSISQITDTSPSDNTGLSVTTTKVRLGEVVNTLFRMVSNIHKCTPCSERSSCHVAGPTPKTQSRQSRILPRFVLSKYIDRLRI